MLYNNLILRPYHLFPILLIIHKNSYFSEQFEAFEHLKDISERSITYEKAFLFSLWYLANSETFRQCADRFDLSQSSSHKVLCKTLKFIISLKHKYLKWPTEQESKRVCQQFKSKYNINGIMGAIDGCHIRIRRPTKHEEDYVNRKGFHSILLQGVCDYRKLFIDVHIGESGSLHDARVLRKSPLYRVAQEDRNIFHDFFLLGDSAYPNLKWLAPPFKNHGQLTDNQILFNVKHSSARSVIEHAFGLLKGRFRRLFYLHNLNIDIINECVMAACILHNISILTDCEVINDPEMQNENANTNLNARERMFSEMFP